MLSTLRRLLHLERSQVDLKATLRARDLQIASLNADREDALRRLTDQEKATARLRSEIAGCPRDPRDPVAAALQAVVLDLGSSEWATPEHAQEILQALIERHYNRGWTALVIAGREA